MTNQQIKNLPVAERIRIRLEEFLEKLQNGETIRCTRVTKKMTPDGPLHTFEEDVLFKDNHGKII